MATYQGKIYEVPLVHATRAPQLKIGFLIDGTDKQTVQQVATPRKEPLETAWKHAMSAKT